MMQRPDIKPADAFAQLQENKFADVESENCTITIEPGQAPIMENMLAIVDGEGDTCNMFAVHEGGTRWQFAG